MKTIVLIFPRIGLPLLLVFGCLRIGHALDSLYNDAVKRYQGVGILIGGGPVSVFPVGQQSGVPDRGMGYEFQLGFLARRFGLELCVTGIMGPTTSEMVLYGESVPNGAIVEWNTTGIQASYALVYG
ncbi:MAG: hypothetical protein MUC47_09520 [Candidatus Kapabacteria bacterium]|nr:hypothetical protein [Candidatus Kapabacteria bacterium]